MQLFCKVIFDYFDYVFADDIVAIMCMFYCNVSGLCALLLLLLNKIKLLKTNRKMMHQMLH